MWMGEGGHYSSNKLSVFPRASFSPQIRSRWHALKVTVATGQLIGGSAAELAVSKFNFCLCGGVRGQL